MKTNEVLIIAGFAAGAFFLLKNVNTGVAVRRPVAAGSTPAASVASAVNQVFGASLAVPFGGYLPVPYSGGETLMGVNNSVPFWNDFSFIRVK